MPDLRCQRLTARIEGGLLRESSGPIARDRRRELRRVAAAVAELLSLKGPAWPAKELGLSPRMLTLLEELGLAARWARQGGEHWLALTQRAADLGERVPSSDGGLKDSAVSRSVAIEHGMPAITPYRKPEGAIPYAKELAGGSGLFARARWAS